MEHLQRRDKVPSLPVRLVRTTVGRGRSWVVLALTLIVSGLLLAFGGSPTPSTSTGSDLPVDSESAQVRALRASLPSSKVEPAIVVFTRAEGPLTSADLAAVDRVRTAVADEAVGQVRPAQVAPDRAAALVAVPLPASLSDDEVGPVVESLRAGVRAELPAGLRADVTGGPAFSADLGAVFDGADVTLLGATALVVAVLLLITYRSPWVWLVPLATIAVGDQVAAKLVAIASRTLGLAADGGVTGITSVLVFGAGTNYALLLIARYREELHAVDDRREAMRRALGSAAPAILASSSTVILALLSLGFAQTPFVTAIGYAGAIGIATAVVYALVVLPSALVVFPRGLFWPFTPRVGQLSDRPGVWTRIGEAVVRRPRTVAVASVAVLAVLASGAVGLDVGLSQNEQFRSKPEAVVGQERLAAAFEAGSGQPTTVIARTARAGEVVSAARSVPGVGQVTPAGGDDERTEVNVVLRSDPGTSSAFSSIERLRTAVHAVPGADAVVGGPDAEALDSRDAAARDRVVIIPIILAIVLVILLVLLRSIVAAVVLVLTVVATYAASIGASWTMFDRWFGFVALDLSTPLLGFLFLVALGIDYNIFLTTRAREETEGATPTEGIVRALGATGGVITSAGILLAAVFTVLGVLPLITLTQLGVIVGFGVLLDTLLVRSVLVPALVRLLDRRFWWPGHLSRPEELQVISATSDHR